MWFATSGAAWLASLQRAVAPSAPRVFRGVEKAISVTVWSYLTVSLRWPINPCTVVCVTAAQFEVRTGNAWTLALSGMVAAQIMVPVQAIAIVRLVHTARACRPGLTHTSGNLSMASLTGTVKFYNETKGFGFITPDGGGKDVFVHATALEKAGVRGLRDGQRVSFDTEADTRGPKAVNLRLA
jgi:CspA family cold shock protein